MRPSSPSTFFCLSMLAACGSASDRPAHEPGDAAPSTSASATTSPVAAPEVGKEPGDAAPSGPSFTAGAPLHVVVQTDENLRLFPIDGAMFVAGDTILSRVEGDAIVRDDRLAKLGLSFGAVIGVTGQWPNDTHAIAVDSNGRVGWGVSFDWAHDHWKAGAAPLAETWTYQTAERWNQGRILAVEAWTMPLSPGPRLKLQVLGHGEAGLELAKSDDARCPERIVDPIALHVLADGTVFLLGTDCMKRTNGAEDTLAVERWDPGARTSVVTPLAEKGAQADAGHFFAGTKRDDVYLTVGGVTASGALYHFDGKVWSRDASPPGPPLLFVAMGKDGTLFGVAADRSGNEVLARKPGGAWETRPLPSAFPLATKEGLPPGATDIAVDDAGDLWVSAHGALLRERAPAAAATKLDWPRDLEFASSVTKMPRAATRNCESLYVLLYGFSKVTPDDYDFPLTRKALKGHTEFASARFVVTEEGGHKFFGAFATDYDLATKMVDRIQKDVKGSSPQLLCAKPSVVREVKLDLATGEVKK